MIKLCLYNITEPLWLNARCNFDHLCNKYSLNYKNYARWDPLDKELSDIQNMIYQILQIDNKS